MKTLARSRLVLVLLCSAGLCALHADPTVYDRPVELTLGPAGGLPLGTFGPYLEAGPGAMASATFRPWSLPIAFGAGSRFSFMPLEDGTGSLESYTVEGKAGFRARLGSRVRVSANLVAGPAFSVFRSGGESTFEPDFFYGADAGIGYHFSRSVFADVRLSFTGITRLNHAAGLSASLGFALGSPSRYFASDLPTPDYDDGVVGVSELRVARLFPALYAYYDANPLGSMMLTNWAEEAITDLRVTVFVDRFMDVPRVAICPDTLGPAQAGHANLHALFTDEILLVTAATRTPAVFEVSYTLAGESRSFAFEHPLEIADRNAITWDDDHKVAAFVTETDPIVATFARGAAGTVRNAGFAQVPENFRIAVGLFEALRLHGTDYVTDPNTPYAELSDTPEAVDYLQFPRQTLETRAGDCDDLSVCYASMLETAGVPSAFVTVPGHILAAFAIGLDPADARRQFANPEQLIITESGVWIPIEVTMVREGFAIAWQEGVRVWTQHHETGTAELFDVATARRSYEGVGLLDTGRIVSQPPEAELLRAYRDEIRWFARMQLEPRLAATRSRIASEGDAARHRNSLGVAFARADLLPEAETEFFTALALDPAHLPSRVNLANTLLLRGDAGQALEHLRLAESQDAHHAGVQLGMAKAFYELNDVAATARYFAALRAEHPETAERYPYLNMDSVVRTRQSDIASQKSLVEWEVE